MKFWYIWFTFFSGKSKSSQKRSEKTIYVFLLDKTGEDLDEFKFNENCRLTKGFFVSILTGSVEKEIRETITSLFKEKYPLIGENDFLHS